MGTLRTEVRLAVAAGLIGLALGVVHWGPAPVGAAAALAQDESATRREFNIVARKYEYQPARIEVRQDDLLKITLTSDDIAHSFTIDAYRIAKRVGPGRDVTFEFRADQVGTFPIYCNLKQDERCREMHGTLVVQPH